MTLEIILPAVGGVPPGDYEIMEIKVKPTGNLGPVTVTIFDEDDSVFEVSDLIMDSSLKNTLIITLVGLFV